MGLVYYGHGIWHVDIHTIQTFYFIIFMKNNLSSDYGDK